jgi:hypothetical protein
MKLPAMAKRRVRYFRDRKFATAWSKREDPYVVLKNKKSRLDYSLLFYLLAHLIMFYGHPA